MNYFWAFVVGGGICVIGQLLIDLTGLTPARILTGYVVAGVILSAVGWYAPLAEFAGCGGHCAAAGLRPSAGERRADGHRRGRGHRHPHRRADCRRGRDHHQPCVRSRLLVGGEES